mgnify:CR=1 FL=1
MLVYLITFPGEPRFQNPAAAILQCKVAILTLFSISPFTYSTDQTRLQAKGKIPCVRATITGNSNTMCTSGINNLDNLVCKSWYMEKMMAYLFPTLF